MHLQGHSGACGREAAESLRTWCAPTAGAGPALLANKPGGAVGGLAERDSELIPREEVQDGCMPKVLVVDDEAHITELVSMALRYNNFDSELASSGRSALEAVVRDRPDLVILDVSLPDLDGFEVARRLRESDGPSRHLPIIFLTARDTTSDKVHGLTLGGDDYVTKPFSVEELVARVVAVLRRSGVVPGSSGDRRLAFADLELDEDAHEVRRAGKVIELTPTEFRLLHYLLANPRRVLTRDQILDRVWDYDFEGNASVLETYISYLRRKVDAVDPPLIHTVRGVGYSLRLPRAERSEP